jgi:hypothetical protein
VRQGCDKGGLERWVFQVMTINLTTVSDNPDRVRACTIVTLVARDSRQRPIT